MTSTNGFRELHRISVLMERFWPFSCSALGLWLGALMALSTLTSCGRFASDESSASGTAASVSPRTTTDGKLRCSISANADDFRVGDHFRLSVRVENASDREIWLYFPAVYKALTLTITNELGVKVDKRMTAVYEHPGLKSQLHRLAPGEAYEDSIEGFIEYEFARASQGSPSIARRIVIDFTDVHIDIIQTGRFTVALELTADEKVAKLAERMGVGPIWPGTLKSNDIGFTTTVPTRRNLDRAIREIGSEDTAVALRAVEKVSANCDPRAVPALLTTLKTENGALVRPAASALARIQDTSILPQLESIYRTTRQGEIQRIVLETMHSLQPGDRVVSLLIETVRSGVTQKSRKYAAYQIGLRKLAQGADAVIAAAKEEERPVRYSAIDGLGLLGQTQDANLRAKIVAVLLDILRNDGDRTMRGRAAGSLGQIGDPSTIPALIEALHDPNNFVGADAAHALRRFAGEEALEPLRQFAAAAETESQRQAATTAISEIQARLQRQEGH